MGTTGQSITLANSIIGVGILAMPFCFQQCGVLLATLILLLMGLVSRLCCYFLLKSALIARRRNFEFLAFHVFGSAGKFAVEMGIIGFLMGSCIAYFVVVGDLGPQIISKMFNINQSDMLRTSIMVIVSLVCVLPLGLLRNVDSLSNVSAATIGFYLCLVMKVTADAATVLMAGDWQTRVVMWRPAGILQCVPIFSMALFCQTQLFELFESLPSLSLEKMNVVTKNAINICTCVYFTLGLFGYIAFNTQEISGNILMSLSPTMASDVIKLGFVMSLAFSFPLIIFPCRASLYSLLYKKVHSSHHDHIAGPSIPESSFRRLTVCIVAAALAVSLLLPNIELVLGLVGSTIGVLVCVVFPAACFINVTFKNTNERLLAKGILILGLVIMILGTYANLQAAENQVDKYDEKYITKERIDKIVEDFFEKREKSDVRKPESDTKDLSNKQNGDVIKESVILPPNPVPPESHSNEKNINNDASIENVPKMKEVLPKPIIKDSLDKVSKAHPRNLNKLNDTKISNGDTKQKQKDDDVKPQSNDDKANMLKQQQLIETIKQHGEEQRELIKEQKQILSEIKKTKEELQKNKNEAANDEAKKIAVESIKKIANIAMQSLAGVSEKPDQAGEVKKVKGLEKFADEAVQEIAQKAKETIEAIKETQEKSDQALEPVALPILPDVQNTNNVNSDHIQSNVPVNNQNVQSNLQAIKETQEKSDQALKPVALPILPDLQNTNNVNLVPIQSNVPVNNQNIQSNLPNPSQGNVQNNADPNILNNLKVNYPNIAAIQNAQNDINNQHTNMQPAVNVPQQVQSKPNVYQAQPNIGQVAPDGLQAQANNGQIAVNNNQVAPNNNPIAVNNDQLVSNNNKVSINNAQLAPNNGQVAVNEGQAATNNGKVAVNSGQVVNNGQVAMNTGQAAKTNDQVGVINSHDATNIGLAQLSKSANNGQSPLNIPVPANNIEQVVTNVKSAEPNNVKPLENQPAVSQGNVQIAENVIQSQHVQNNIYQEQQVQNITPQDNKVETHSHSPDEPQSYKQGEDSQKQNNVEHNLNNMIAQKVPLALAMNGNTQGNKQVNNFNANAEINNNIINKDVQNNAKLADNKVDNSALGRQKREVVDCSEKSVLKPEDKAICKALIDTPSLKIDDDVKDILSSKVDLNDVGLPKNLPMQTNVLHHISRTLKLFNEDNEDAR